MTSPTAIPSVNTSLDRVRRLLDGSAPFEPDRSANWRERHALDVAGVVLKNFGPDSAALFLQYAHPWVQTGETA